MRSRNIRLVVALVVASLLATIFVYTAVFAGAVQVLQVDQVLADPAKATDTVRLNGWVVSHRPVGEDGLRIVLRDNGLRSSGRLAVIYHGTIPEAFRDGRAILVDGRIRNGTFVAQRDSLSTKCPSKYQAKVNYATTAAGGSST
jgi:cytochrome c-type biogenesis protein CcmE